jgi:hypothetical protein
VLNGGTAGSSTEIKVLEKEAQDASLVGRSPTHGVPLV